MQSFNRELVSSYSTATFSSVNSANSFIKKFKRLSVFSLLIQTNSGTFPQPDSLYHYIVVL